MVKSSLLNKKIHLQMVVFVFSIVMLVFGERETKKSGAGFLSFIRFLGCKILLISLFFSTPASRKNKKKLQWCNLTPKKTLILSKHPRTIITYHLLPIRLPHQQLSYQNNLQKKITENCSAMSNKESIPKTQPISEDPNLLPPSIHLSNLPDIDSAR